VYIDINDDDNLRVLEFFGLKTEDCPTLRLILLEEDPVKYRPEKLDLSSSGIQQFVQDYLDGKLKVHILARCSWILFVTLFSVILSGRPLAWKTWIWRKLDSSQRNVRKLTESQRKHQEKILSRNVKKLFLLLTLSLWLHHDLVSCCGP